MSYYSQITGEITAHTTLVQGHEIMNTLIQGWRANKPHEEPVNEWFKYVENITYEIKGRDLASITITFNGSHKAPWLEDQIITILNIFDAHNAIAHANITRQGEMSEDTETLKLTTKTTTQLHEAWLG